MDQIPMVADADEGIMKMREKGACAAGATTRALGMGLGLEPRALLMDEGEEDGREFYPSGKCSRLP
jgi:hypothetical protein